MEKCPHCDERISAPSGTIHTVLGIKVLVLYCPRCSKILGAVNAEPSEAYTF